MRKSSKKSSAALEIEDFGRALITTFDLDPVYYGLVRMEWPGGHDQLKRWLVSYWCYYHCGVACRMSELEAGPFWDVMTTAARNEKPAPTGGRWPRSAERRHFRGEQAIDAVSALRLRYERPEDMVDYIVGGHDGPDPRGEQFKAIFDRTSEHRNFGPWISFKAADMIDRCGLNRVLFDNAAIFMFTDPAKAVDILWERRGGYTKAHVQEETGVRVRPLDPERRRNRVVAHLAEKFSDLRAPPLGDRPVNIQEIETVLCKWKSHLNGHYAVGKDTREVLHGLSEWWPHCHTAANMSRALAEPMQLLVEGGWGDAG